MQFAPEAAILAQILEFSIFFIRLRMFFKGYLLSIVCLDTELLKKYASFVIPKDFGTVWGN